MNPDLLNSWKEIASYLGRGVRTVQRWETELALPVHRPHHRSRSIVIASRSELNNWLRVKGGLSERVVKIPDNIALLRAQRQETQSRREQLRQTVNDTRRLIASLSAIAKKKSASEIHEGLSLESNHRAKCA